MTTLDDKPKFEPGDFAWIEKDWEPKAYKNFAYAKVSGCNRVLRDAASLAHRYALSMDGIDTVVLGVKNRAELRECIEAEANGRLTRDVVSMIDRMVALS